MKSFLLSSRRCLAVLAAPFCQKRGAIHLAAKPAGELHEYATHLSLSKKSSESWAFSHV